MRKPLIPLLLLCVLLLIAPLASAQENIVKNGGFEQASGEMPKDWVRGMWVTDWGVTLYTLSEISYEGRYSACVENVSANDARYEQVLSVKPQTYYRFSAMVRAEDCDPAFKGANISVADIYETSPDVHDTGGEWVELSFYGYTGKGQNQITLMARVGGYGSENVGTAWFDSVTAEEVSDVPAGATVLDLLPPAQETSTESSTPGNSNLILLCAAGLLFAWLLWIITRNMVANNAPMPLAEKRGNPLLWGGLAVLALVRVLVAVWVPGYGVDMNCFFAWGSRLANVGPGQFYAKDYFCDYPPGYLYILWGEGALLKALDVPLSADISRFILKFAPIASDIVTAWLLYHLAQKPLGKRAATGLALLYALNPVTFVTGAAWGQVDAVLVLLLALTLWQAEQGKWHFAIPLFALAALVKPQALMLAPLGLLALCQDLANRHRAKEEAWWKNPLIGLGAALALVAALTLPFTGDQSPFWLIEKYQETLASYPHASVNAANLFYLLGGNWVGIETSALFGVSWEIWGYILMGLWMLWVLFLGAWSKDTKARLWELSSLFFLGIFVLGVKMHERYVFPAIFFSLMAYVRSRDRRWLWVFGGITFTSLINIGMVLVFEHLIAPYVWVGQVLAGLNLLVLALATWTMADHVFFARFLPVPPYTPKPLPAVGDSLSRAQRAILTVTDSRLHMRKWDWILMLGITGIYAVVAFWGLGDTKAPQTFWRSGEAGQEVIFDLGDVHDVRMLYYSGISHDTFTIAYSIDNEEWTDPARAEDTECFRWQEFELPLEDGDGELLYDDKGNVRYSGTTEIMTARYVRLTSLGGRLVLGEVGFRTPEDQRIPVVAVLTEHAMEGLSNPKLLADEQSTVPVHPTYMNGTYFDEIYHARTAYEHLNGMAPFESSHPPLGKLIMAVGIWLFGMTPFGWRFMGVLMGVLMVPAMYLMGKQLLRRTRWGVLMALLMALDMMHLTQTRIATIDSYAVFFIILMYLCMFRYVMMSFYHQKLWRTLVPLGLSGFFMGLGIASKWIGIYAAVGLAVLFFYTLYCRWEEYHICADWENQEEGPAREKMREIRGAFWPNALLTLGCCVLFFLIIPAVIYYLSYVPYLRPTGAVTLSRIWDVQVHQMFNYHSGLVDAHAFQSDWWSWPVIGKPMWYYQSSYKTVGTASSILAFGNPAIWWAGLLCLVLVIGNQCYRVYARIFDEPSARIERLHRTTMSPSGMVLIGFLSNYLPWVLVPRSMFIYHYFASLPFVMLCIGLCFNWLNERYPKRTKVAYVVYVLVVLVLFVAFYPLGTGVTIPRAWADAVNWFPRWLWY